MSETTHIDPDGRELETIQTPRGTIKEKRDGVVYSEDGLYLGFHWQDHRPTERVVEFGYGEKRYDASDTEAVEGDEVWLKVESVQRAPDPALEAIDAAGYTIVGYDGIDDSEAPLERDRDEWLYQGECPECGSGTVLIERLEKPDLCYICGTEVTEEGKL